MVVCPHKVVEAKTVTNKQTFSLNNLGPTISFAFEPISHKAYSWMSVSFIIA